MAKPKKATPFDVTFTDEELKNLGEEWSRAIDDALSARSSIIGTGGVIDLLDWFYEQGRSDPADRPFPGAADLTSFFITENVDAYRARLMKAVFGVEPFCVVDGWGPDAEKAPFVEAFHEWQVDEEGLPDELAKVVHGALIEDCHILEVRERVETRKIVEQMDVALEVNEFGGPIMGNDGKPKLKRHPTTGDFIPAKDGEPSARIESTSTKSKRLGPEYDVISMKDFVFLPGHARNQRQVWGYAYRFWPRVPELQEKVKDGLYDKDAVALLGDHSDRESADVTTPTPVDQIAPQTGDAAEKEMWALYLKADLDKDGREEWYTVTLSRINRVVLRVKLDTFVMKVGIPRCVPFVLFPRRNSVYGYSYAGDKMLTLAEEHTALRNMRADRGALATAAPIKVLSSALWDPDAEPIGVGRVIHVKDMGEVQQMEVADVPQSTYEQENALFAAKERVGGLSDMAVGVNPKQGRTLGENEMVASGSAVRVEETLGYLRRAIKRVMKLRHAIWIDTLESDPKGLEAPSDIVSQLQSRGLDVEQAMPDGRFTAQLLKGKFQFKPYGSVETSDVNRRMFYFNQSLQTLGGLAKEFQALGRIFQSDEVARALVQEWGRTYKVRTINLFLKALMPQPGAPALPAAGGQGGPAPMAPGGPAAGAPPGLAALAAMAGRGGATPPMGAPGGG